MIKIRPYQPSDDPFIFTSWANSLRPFVRWVPKSEYQRIYSRAIRASLDECTTWVACLQDMPDAVVGWIHGTDDVIHYLFVRQNYRDLPAYPIANNLTEQLVDINKQILYTHWTFDFRRRLRDNYVYRPDLFRPELPRRSKSEIQDKRKR